MNKKPECFKTSVGGQALMEGIMMRGPKLICCAVRKPDGSIETKTEPTPQHSGWMKLPILRGAVSMIESLVLGYRRPPLKNGWGTTWGRRPSRRSWPWRR